jgi:hypothetical protein
MPCTGPAAGRRPPPNPEQENTPDMTEAQLAANRENAKRSTGPRSPEGKTRSSQNARKHGFTATTFPVIRLEEVHEVAHLRADLFALYQPRNSQEMFALERLALAQQSLLRAYRLESGLFTRGLNQVIEDSHNMPLMTQALAGDLEITTAQNRNFLCAEGFMWSHMVKHDKQNPWTTFLRYQAQAERLYRRALDEFQRIRAEAPTLPEPIDLPDDQPDPDLYHRPQTPYDQPLPNEPNLDPNPLNPTPLPPPETNPPTVPPAPPAPAARSNAPLPWPSAPAARSDAPRPRAILP